MDGYLMDKKAKKILFETHWKNGWIDSEKQTISQEDFLYAKEKGLMFDPLNISHDECVARIVALASEIPQSKLARAFLASLSTRRLELRSGIASWAVAQKFSAHTFSPFEYSVIKGNTRYICGTCKELSNSVFGKEHYQVIENEYVEDADLNVLNFERIKWGGVRHGQLLFTMFDLEQFQKEDVPEPNNDDITIFNDILSIIDSSDPNDHPGKLRERLSEVVGLKSSKYELSVLLEILACIGVLKPSNYNRPYNARNDWKFVEYWRGEDKYDKEVVENLFGEYTKYGE